MGANAIEDLQARYRADPASVDPSWHVLLQVLDDIEEATGSGMPRGAPSDAALSEAIRAHGHRLARLDPLSPERGAPEPQRFTAELAERTPPAEELARLYAGTLTVETAHIDDPAARNWLRAAFEEMAHGGAVPPARQSRILAGLIEADEFERFLSVKFPTKKRFGAEGIEAFVPMLQRLLEHAAAKGVTHAVIGTMHRGRLSLLANVLGKPLARMLAEIKGAHPFAADPPRAGDVPYHLGLETTLTLDGRDLHVTLLPNPSHLEAVNTLVLGRARALQDLHGADAVLPILLHTDAAVIGQGIVAEMLQLGRTAGFGTGGTVHIVLNNRIGFTTEEEESRSSTHCTGAWKAIDSAILHVNAEDPLAACRAAELAFDYRQSQARDAVIDLVGYRRNGHNEIDEPTFTQPLLYEAVRRQPPVAAAFAARIGAEAQAEELRLACRERMQRAYEEAAGYRVNESGYPAGQWAPFTGGTAGDEPSTGVEEPLLRRFAASLAESPEDFALHARMGRVLRQRAIGDDALVAWPTAEALAFASLLNEGTPVRLTGQDVVRGAFSHRHFGLVDTVTGRKHVGLAGMARNGAAFSVFNSPLSEYAVLGFEYGYSLGRPEGLTLWEAQFGDFANGAQVMIDQFIMAAEEKWCLPSGLVVLLPHGLEGQGPEHSSARIERYLQMAAQDNARIVSPSTPANYFHMLRRQVLAARRKPLIVMSPKKLLRLPAAVSKLADFLPGTGFQPVIASVPEGKVDHVILCTGKIAYDLEEERARSGAAGTAIIRIEQLYPFPAARLSALFRQWPGATFHWVQEEPENMGAWNWLDRRLERLLREAGVRAPTVAYVGRPESASPAGSFHGDHDSDQRALIEQAFAVAASPMRAARAS
jgi:2-oxoglutarate dehydrogenase E1 component